MELKIIVEILFGLLVAAYGVILRSTKNNLTDRIDKIEEKQEKYQIDPERIKKIEVRQDKMDPVITEVRSSLARIETDLKWIKKNK